MNPAKFKLPSNFVESDANLWIECSIIAKKYNSLNLGHGVPDFTAPKILSDALAEVSKGTDPGIHQYTRDFGYPRLVNAVSKLYSPLFNREINPFDEILITNGAIEALYCTFLGYLEAEDEIIIIEPYYTRYDYMIHGTGATIRYIPLRPKKDATSSSDWVFDESELESLFNPKTKMIIVNSPHNPTGKVFTLTELQVIADLCMKWDVICVSDEVYEWMVYEPSHHVRIATLPGMWERTLTIGSAGKTFSGTGWRIGWAFGPSSLLHNLRFIHQNCVIMSCSPLQDALARVIEHEEKLLGKKESYLGNLAESFMKKRDFMARALGEAGIKPILPDSGYFMIADWSKSVSEEDLEAETDKYRDYRFIKWFSKNVRLQMFPLSAFYSEANKHLGEDFVRVCFIKEEKTLEKIANILRNWKRNELQICNNM